MNIMLCFYGVGWVDQTKMLACEGKELVRKQKNPFKECGLFGGVVLYQICLKLFCLSFILHSINIAVLEFVSSAEYPLYLITV